MESTTKTNFWKNILWPWNPTSNLEAGSAIVKNFLLHWFPHRVANKSIAFGYSAYLGTITFTLFLILTLTGVILMFHYTPSVERAYWSIKDLEYAISFGWFLRRLHRLSAHLMVAMVFLHMFRVFYTGSYKDGLIIDSHRSLNWILGVLLLILTLLLSFTGYLLPWDQLAFWAITVGTNIAASVPFIGEQLREAMLGGTIIGQNALIRFYVLHVFLLPVILFALAIWHMWRIRKDGGLAIIDEVREKSKQQNTSLPKKSKTYSILGMAKGVTAQVMDPTVLNEENSVPSSPHLTFRILNIVLATLLITIILAVLIPAPLEEAANPQVTPNPAKAPWYFLGLQEMVGYSALVGGVLFPLFLILWLIILPLLDKDQNRIGVWFTNAEGKKWSFIGFIWGFVFTLLSIFIGVNFPLREVFTGIESQIFFEFVNPAILLLLSFFVLYAISKKLTHSNRMAMTAVFSAFVIAFILLTYTGTALRGPNWEFFWPWESWPPHARPY